MAAKKKPVSESPVTRVTQDPKALEWRYGTYGGASLRLGNGLVVIYCDYALVSRGEENYYYARVNELKLTTKFKSMEDAKRAAVRVAFKLSDLAHEQLKNFLEDIG
jgi:hypothetical protein